MSALSEPLKDVWAVRSKSTWYAKGQRNIVKIEPLKDSIRNIVKIEPIKDLFWPVRSNLTWDGTIFGMVFK